VNTTGKNKVVLFSGGTASNLLAKKLEEAGLAVTNVVAVFDNGGSTGALRRISPVPMPAIGDIRNRLVALSAYATPSELAVKRLFEARLSERKSEKQLREEMTGFVTGSHYLLSDVPEAQTPVILEALKAGAEILPLNFSLRELSIGNLLLFGRMVQARDLLKTIKWARDLLQVQSEVLPVTLDSVHLGVLCQGGQWVRGQWAITDEKLTFPGRVERICLLRDEQTYAWEASATLCSAVAEVLQDADAFIVGFGSFLTSILPQFLVRGVGSAFVTRSIPKIFLCNQTIDKETAQFTVASMLEAVTQCALADIARTESSWTPLTHVLRFGSDQDTGIPVGNLAAKPIHHLDFPEIIRFEAIADKTVEVILSIMGLQPSAVAYPRSPSRSTIVLFDLDATLFDYSNLRLRATAAALDGVVADPRLISQELFDLLRPPLTDILSNVGELPDLRREWDSPHVLALACLLSDLPARQTLNDLAGAVGKLETSEEDFSLRSRVKSYQYAVKLRNSPTGLRFIEALTRVRDRSSHFFDGGARRFREYVAANAPNLAEDARTLISTLMDLAVEVHVVSEGDTPIQRFKFDSLKLNELVQTCVVTDATCSVTPILNELFIFYKDSRAIPHEVVQLYDHLAPYTVKSPLFFCKLLHALKDQTAGGLQERVQSVRFLTKKEWHSSPDFSVVMIGDRYRKDLEPLLQVCPSGVKAYRLLTGRYFREDPLHELIEARRPLPNGVFPDLRELAFLRTAISTPGDMVGRPIPILPDPIIIERVLANCCDGLSQASRTTLVNFQSEALRHQEDQ